MMEPEEDDSSIAQRETKKTKNKNKKKHKKKQQKRRQEQDEYYNDYEYDGNYDYGKNDDNRHKFDYNDDDEDKDDEEEEEDDDNTFEQVRDAEPRRSKARNQQQQEPKETIAQKTQRQVGSCCQHGTLCCFSITEKARIRLLEHKLSKRQKKFGVQYLDLVERRAGQLQLKACLRKAMDDMAIIQGEIDYHYGLLEGKQEEVIGADKVAKRHSLEKSQQQQQTQKQAPSSAKKNQKKVKNRNRSDVNDKEAAPNPLHGDRRPIFTIDSDDEEDYYDNGAHNTDRKATSSNVKKKKPKKDGKNKSNQNTKRKEW
jgi:hypothetical protein